MSTHTLYTYLESHPAIDSASRLARRHEVDTKTVTRALRRSGYSLVQPADGTKPTWVYNAPVYIDQFDLHCVAVSRPLLQETVTRYKAATDHPFHSFTDLSQSQDPETFAMQCIMFGLTYLYEHDKLPIRAQITPSGFIPLTMNGANQ